MRWGTPSIPIIRMLLILYVCRLQDFVAEVASTCNEALIRHLLNRTEETQEKRHSINHFLESLGTLFRSDHTCGSSEAASHRKAQEGENSPGPPAPWGAVPSQAERGLFWPGNGGGGPGDRL